MKRQLLFAAFSILIGAVGVVQADPGRLAIAGRSSTLGFGGDLIVNILEDLNVRAGIGFFNYDFDGEISDIEYDFGIDLLTYPIMLDWYPFDNDFHISGGIIINDTEIGMEASYNGSIRIGDTTYTPGEIGILSGDLTFDRVAPYVGIGWGNAFGRSRRWGFMSDAGVAFTGSPKIALATTGTVTANDLAQEEQELEDDLEDFSIYPVFSASLYFRF